MLNINAGIIFHIQGTNGIGKSTLIKTLARELKPHQGKIRYHFDSNDIFYLPQHQSPDLHCPISLKEVAELDLTHGSSQSVAGFDWFNRSLHSRTWNNASGGERMRALLARALLSARTVLLLDEPFNHLDEETHAKVLESFEHYVRDKRRVIVVVSHTPLYNLDSRPEIYSSWTFATQKEA